MVQPETLLEPVSAEDPCGPDLEYDKAFTDLDRLAQGRPEQQVGNTIVPAEPPDWKQVEKQATALFERTRDLRVTMWLLKALVHTGGLPGLVQGLTVLHGLIERYWVEVHPRLDPDDDNDPSMRVNIISELCDGAAMVQWVRNLPIVSARGLGKFSMRDVAIANGEAQADAGSSAPEMSSIDAAFRASLPADVQATADALKICRQKVYDIESLVTDQVGASNAADLSKLRTLLGQGLKVVEQKLEADGGGEAATSEEGDGASGDGTPSASGGSSGTSSGPARLSGEISSRQDVLRALDKIMDYYEKHEPASPIPLFVYRCKRMVNMSFLDIMRELAPDGVTQIQTLVGRTKEEEGS